MVELGFIHGRFQLFHNDHLNYALLAKEQCKKLIVGITSPENATLIREEVDPHRSEAASNPFTYFERYNMVKLALLEAGVKREDFEIVPYPIERPEILYNYVPLSATSFFTIYDKWGDEVKSKREQVLEVIDSLPLTWQQKDALYLAAGYAESKILDVPW